MDEEIQFRAIEVGGAVVELEPLAEQMSAERAQDNGREPEKPRCQAAQTRYHGAITTCHPPTRFL